MKLRNWTKAKPSTEDEEEDLVIFPVGVSECDSKLRRTCA